MEPADESQSPTACTQCGAALVGPYCHECGLASRSWVGPFRELTRELADTFLAIDRRFFRTLFDLVRRPGAVPAALLAGLTVIIAAGIAMAMFVTGGPPDRERLIPLAVASGVVALLMAWHRGRVRRARSVPTESPRATTAAASP